jgi:hypothetical protein
MVADHGPALRASELAQVLVDLQVDIITRWHASTSYPLVRWPTTPSVAMRETQQRWKHHKTV